MTAFQHISSVVHTGEMILLLCISILSISFSGASGQATFSCNASAPCGCSARPAVVSRLLNGEIAPDQTWGWAVSLLLNNSYVCGGVLISSSWVLTSVGCLDAYRPPEVVVFAGTNVLFGTKQFRLASRLILHPEVNWNTGVNDIALIMVASPFNMSDPAISLICLPSVTTTDYPPIDSSVSSVVPLDRRSALLLFRW